MWIIKPLCVDRDNQLFEWLSIGHRDSRKNNSFLGFYFSSAASSVSHLVFDFLFGTWFAAKYLHCSWKVRIWTMVQLILKKLRKCCRNFRDLIINSYVLITKQQLCRGKKNAILETDGWSKRRWNLTSFDYVSFLSSPSFRLTLSVICPNVASTCCSETDWNWRSGILLSASSQCESKLAGYNWWDCGWTVLPSFCTSF